MLGLTQRGAPITIDEIDRYVHCTWEFQQKLQPTDRREGQQFGRTVYMEEEQGTIVVVSEGAAREWSTVVIVIVIFMT